MIQPNKPLLEYVGASYNLEDEIEKQAWQRQLVRYHNLRDSGDECFHRSYFIVIDNKYVIDAGDEPYMDRLCRFANDLPYGSANCILKKKTNECNKIRVFLVAKFDILENSELQYD